MSCGIWGHRQYAVQDTLTEVAEAVKEDLPNLSALFDRLSQEIFEIMNRLDLHYSASSHEPSEYLEQDGIITDLPAFEERSLEALRGSTKGADE